MTDLEYLIERQREENSMDDKSKVAADIQELVSQLNTKLQEAIELGLKVSVCSPMPIFMFGASQVRVRIWEETEYGTPVAKARGLVGMGADYHHTASEMEALRTNPENFWTCIKGCGYDLNRIERETCEVCGRGKGD